MTLEFIDGFDQYGLDESQMLDGNWSELFFVNLTQDADKVRTGTTALLFLSTNSSPVARRAFNLQGTTKIVCFSARITSALPLDSFRNRMCLFSDSDNKPQVSLFVMTTGQLRIALYDSSGNIVTTIQSTTPLISVSNYHSYQFKVFIDDAFGAIEVRIDNEVVVWDGATTNLDTDPTGYGSTGQFTLGGRGGGGSPPSSEITMDDLFVLNDLGAVNNDFIGDKQAFLLLPDGNGVTQDWGFTGGATAWESIDEIPADGDTSFIDATGVNNTSVFSIEDVATNLVDIAGVQMTHVVRKLDAGAATLQGSLVSNGFDGSGVDRSITENYAHWNDVIELDPDGDIAWTPVKLNATEYKIEKTS